VAHDAATTGLLPSLVDWIVAMGVIYSLSAELRLNGRGQQQFSSELAGLLQLVTIFGAAYSSNATF